MDQNPKSLDDLLSSQESADDTSTDQLLEVLTNAFSSMEGSLGSLHVTIRAANERIATLENFVAYLLSKDPEAGARMKEMADKVNSNEALPTLPKE